MNIWHWFIYGSGCHSWEETKVWLKSPFTKRWWIIKWKEYPHNLRRFWPLVAGIIILGVLDCLSTQAAVKMGFTEKNPNMYYLVHYVPWLAWTVRMGVATLIAFILAFLKKRLTLHLIAILSLLVVYGNLQVIVLSLMGVLESY